MSTEKTISLPVLCAAVLVVTGGLIAVQWGGSEPAAAEVGAPTERAAAPLAAAGKPPTAVSKPVREGSIPPVVAPEDFTWGDPGAPVKIVEFADYQCPYCNRAAKTLATLMKTNRPQDVYIVFKNLPLFMHPSAPMAARAAIAAGRQGKFWAFHDLLFERQTELKSLGKDALFPWIRELGLDERKFIEDMTSRATRAQLDADRAEARRIGISTTPNFFLNGVHRPGLSVTVAQRLIDKLKRQ
jgi:protein-disulfide isomerase